MSCCARGSRRMGSDMTPATQAQWLETRAKEAWNLAQKYRVSNPELSRKWLSVANRLAEISAELAQLED